MKIDSDSFFSVIELGGKMPATANGKDDLDDLSEAELIETLFDARDLAKSLLSALKSNNRKFRRLENWREHQITGFLKILVETVADLVAAHKKNRVSMVAWLTRNLLELSIWSEYCTASESNSLSFFNDSLKDAYGVMRSVEQVDILKLTHLKDDLIRAAERISDPAAAQKLIASVKRDFEETAAEIDDSGGFSDEELTRMAAFIGEQNIRDNHLQVSEVARSLGRGDVFAKQNKFLSKFAHPTAIITHMPPRNIHPLPPTFFLRDASLLSFQCYLLLSAFVFSTFPKMTLSVPSRFQSLLDRFNSQ